MCLLGDVDVRCCALWLSIGQFHDNVVWFDEVYVGAEDTMNFECPITVADTNLRIRRPVQSNWREGGQSHSTAQLLVMYSKRPQITLTDTVT